MSCAQNNSKYVCGIDLYARQMYVCVMNENGEIVFHRNKIVKMRLLASHLVIIIGGCYTVETVERGTMGLSGYDAPAS